MQMKVKLTGFRELDKALSELPKATGKNVQRRVAKGALEPMADLASARAPERTGRLAFSIGVSEKRTRRVKKEQRFDTRTGIAMAMGPMSGFGGTLYYASFDEFGTVDTPAFGFMRSAWDTEADPALNYVKSNLWLEIDKAARRVAKKRG
jgi:HK97 gp10 family phage protein